LRFSAKYPRARTESSDIIQMTKDQRERKHSI
jgi:hypothetical protein